jgi:hypothetical protein
MLRLTRYIRTSGSRQPSTGKTAAGELSAPKLAAIRAARLAPKEAIIVATLCDQPLKVEDASSFAERAVARELELVLVQRADRIEADHRSSF